MAVMVHWTDEDWRIHDPLLLDIVHLKEPIQTGNYLADQPLKIISDFGITSAVFTITRDNATNNHVMRKRFEDVAT